MTEDYQIWSGGKLIAGRSAFKDWVRHFQTIYGNAHTEILIFANAAGNRVVSRWFNTGINYVTPVQLALLNDDGLTGGFFEKDGENPW